MAAGAAGAAGVIGWCIDSLVVAGAARGFGGVAELWSAGRPVSTVGLGDEDR